MENFVVHKGPTDNKSTLVKFGLDNDSAPNKL